MSIRISEIYESIQGEGLLTGTPSVFVRTSGCNLRCSFCDTPFASWNPEGDRWTVEQIVDRVLTYPSTHVVITGGEPTIAPELPQLCAALHQSDRHITIETAGTVYQSLECDLISISPKMSNSTPAADTPNQWSARHDSLRHAPATVAQWMSNHRYQLKFVIHNQSDINEVLQYLETLPASADRDRVLMMPQGIRIEEIDAIASWLLPWCETQGFGFCDRAHIRLFGNRRGT